MELIADLYSGEIASRSSRTVNISGVTLHSLIEIVLISIEHILHTCTQLQVHRLIKFEIIGHLDSHIEDFPYTEYLWILYGNVYADQASLIIPVGHVHRLDAGAAHGRLY